VSIGTDALELADELEDELDDGLLLPHAATTSAALAATAAAAAVLVTECKETTSLMGCTCRTKSTAELRLTGSPACPGPLGANPMGHSINVSVNILETM